MRVKNDNNENDIEYRVYLDRIYTSPNIPKPKGGIGHSSKKTLPSLEHTGIYSSFDPKPANITDSFGRITKEYKWNTCEATAKVEKKRMKVKYHQPFFRQNHCDFLNKVLCDMEDTRSYRIERNRRNWMESKRNMGFGNDFLSYENALSLDQDRLNSNTPLGYKFEVGNSVESFPEVKTIENSAFLTSESFIEMESADYEKTVTFSLENEDSIFPSVPDGNNEYKRSRPSTTNTNISNNSRPNTSISNVSSKSRPSTTFTGQARRKRNAVNRMSLFECLLETTEPPMSPIKRYGSFSPWSERTITTASSLDSRGSELIQKGLEKWSDKSIMRANTGDKPRTKNKEYR